MLCDDNWLWNILYVDYVTVLTYHVIPWLLSTALEWLLDHMEALETVETVDCSPLSLPSCFLIPRQSHILIILSLT